MVHLGHWSIKHYKFQYSQLNKQSDLAVTTMAENIAQ